VEGWEGAFFNGARDLGEMGVCGRQVSLSVCCTNRRACKCLAGLLSTIFTIHCPLLRLPRTVELGGETRQA
jgi:hypothetical protein